MQNRPSPNFEWNDNRWSPPYFLWWGLVLGLLGLALLLGSMPLVGVSPILFAGGILILFITLLYLRAPALALFSTIFVNLLPQGLTPDPIQSVCAVLLLLISLLFWLLQTGFQRRKPIWTAPMLFVLGFFLWAFISILWAPDLVVSRQALVQYSLVITIAFLLINQVNSEQALAGFMNTLAASGWVLLATALWVVLFGNYTLGDRLQIFAMNENLFGLMLILTTAGVVWQVMQASAQTKKFWMLLSIIYILFSLGLIALSGSRGSFVGFVLVLLLFATMKTTRPWARWGAVIGIVGIVCAPFVFATVLDRFTSSTDDLYGERDVLWKAGFLLLNDYPWTGAGIGNGPYLMLDYVNAASDNDHIGQIATRPAHNPFLEVGDDTGIVGMVLYLLAFTSALWLFLRQFYRAVRQRIAFLTAYCSLIFCISIGFLSAWLKSGGLADHITLFVLLALWIIPYRLQFSSDVVQHSFGGENSYG
ncbi:MAG: O-antigen ligase family protein [Chloroflexi bacterium]|nr:O-antigen ligase family protein [Chloroflexota bacterium]